MVWKKTIHKPVSDGSTQLFVNWIKGCEEIEIIKYYDEEKRVYDEEYTIMHQLKIGEDSWEGNELASCNTIKQATTYVEEFLNKQLIEDEKRKHAMIREEFIDRIRFSDLIFDDLILQEFAEEHFQNQNSFEENKEQFLKYLEGD